jgi:NAD+ synthetase
MRLALAQINPTVGDIAGNAALIVRAIGEARAKQADLVVLPELCLCGYPPKDLLLQEGFVAACVAAAKEIGEKHTKGITAIFGVPLPVDAHNPDATGEGIANALLAYRDGLFVDYYDKRLLPTYDVFDEDRYFVPGDRPVVIDIPCRSGATWPVGLSVCEDLWRGEDVGFSHRYRGRKDPVAELCAPQHGNKPGAKLIVNPSASPFVMGKGKRHRDILIKHATTNRVFVAAVNQVGGNDELIFDGHAAVYAPGGTLMAAAPGFQEHVLICDIPDARPAAGATPPAVPADPLLSAPDEQLLFNALTLGIRDYCRKTGFKSALLGLSGGIDSAACAVLAVAALGPKNVLGVSLPSRFSSEHSKSDALALARNLGIEMITVPLEPAHAALLSSLAAPFESAPASKRDTTGVSEENLQSRIRGTILMGLSNKLGHILLTTGNKSEMAVGYATLYGDMNGGLAVLSDVTKHWVYRLALWINANPANVGCGMWDVGCSIPSSPSHPTSDIQHPTSKSKALPPIPESSITKPPSAELRPNQTDQDSLPPYDVLDEILNRYVERRQSPKHIIEETGYDAAVVARVVRLIDISEYKRKQAAIGLKVTGVAFGTGRRWPIAQGWKC